MAAFIPVCGCSDASITAPACSGPSPLILLFSHKVLLARRIRGEAGCVRYSYTSAIPTLSSRCGWDGSDLLNIYDHRELWVERTNRTLVRRNGNNGLIFVNIGIVNGIPTAIPLLVSVEDRRWCADNWDSGYVNHHRENLLISDVKCAM